MNAAHLVFLLAAGLAAGGVNAIAGGGSLITFPALLAIGLSQKAANVTNSVAVAPGYLSALWGSRADLPKRGLLVRLLPTAVVGAALGCALLLATPSSAFKVIVPFLVLAAAVVLAFQTQLRDLVGHSRDMRPRRRQAILQSLVGLGAVYGGYFGAALGVMLVAGLGLVLDEPLNRVNALKNAISTAVGFTTVIYFALFAPVDWVDVAILAPATVVGGYVGARLARRLPAPVLRTIIVTLGFSVGIVLLVEAFK
jgi:uncharacterized membrane protein YfcA